MDLVEAAGAGLPEGLAGKDSANDPDVAERFPSDGPQLTAPADYYFKMMERGDDCHAHQ